MAADLIAGWPAAARRDKGKYFRERDPMSRDAILHSRGAHPSPPPPPRISPGTADKKRRDQERARASPKAIVEYRNSCAIRGLPSALYRVLPGSKYRISIALHDESRTSGLGILCATTTACHREGSSALTGCTLRRKDRLLDPETAILAASFDV